MEQLSCNDSTANHITKWSDWGVMQHVTQDNVPVVDSSWKCDGIRWRTGGEVKGKLMNGVGSQYSSHYLRTWCIQHYYRWCAHLGCASSRLNWRPRQFKLTRSFRRKTKSGFCACAITFQLASNSKQLVDTFLQSHTRLFLILLPAYEMLCDFCCSESIALTSHT